MSQAINSSLDKLSQLVFQLYADKQRAKMEAEKDRRYQQFQMNLAKQNADWQKALAGEQSAGRVKEYREKAKIDADAQKDAIRRYQEAGLGADGRPPKTEKPAGFDKDHFAALGTLKDNATMRLAELGEKKDKNMTPGERAEVERLKGIISYADQAISSMAFSGLDFNEQQDIPTPTPTPNPENPNPDKVTLDGLDFAETRPIGVPSNRKSGSQQMATAKPEIPSALDLTPEEYNLYAAAVKDIHMGKSPNLTGLPDKARAKLGKYLYNQLPGEPTVIPGMSVDELINDTIKSWPQGFTEEDKREFILSLFNGGDTGVPFYPTIDETSGLFDSAVKEAVQDADSSLNEYLNQLKNTKQSTGQADSTIFQMPEIEVTPYNLGSNADSLSIRSKEYFDRFPRKPGGEKSDELIKAADKALKSTPEPLTPKQIEESKGIVKELLTNSGKVPHSAIPAIMASIDVETGGQFDPWILGSNNARGLFQFDPASTGKLNAYLDYIDKNKLSDTHESQVEFFLDNIYGDSTLVGAGNQKKLQKALKSTPEEALNALTDIYFRPGKPNTDQRNAALRKYLK